MDNKEQPTHLAVVYRGEKTSTSTVWTTKLDAIQWARGVIEFHNKSYANVEELSIVDGVDFMRLMFYITSDEGPARAFVIPITLEGAKT